MTIQINGTTGISGVDGSAATPALQGTDSNTGIHFPAADTVAIDTGGSERVRCDSSGRLLVGTSSAFNNANTDSLKILVASTTSGGLGAGFYNFQNDNNWPGIALGRSRNNTVGSHTVVNSGDVLGNITFEGSDGTAFKRAAMIEGVVDATPGTNDMPGRLVFSTTADGASSPTERYRINSIGEHAIYGNTHVQNVISNASAGTAYKLITGRHSGTGTQNGTDCFYVNTNGNVQNTNNSYGAISDAKLKENIVDANSQWDDLKALQVRNYNFKEGQTHTQIGLIAQEVELVSPGLVSECPDRDADGNDLGTVTKSVNYSVLYMKAVKALQEAMERIEQLETEMAAVKAQLS